MEEDIRQTIEEMMGQLRRSKDFKCAESGFTKLCKARDIGLENYLECLEHNPGGCTFRVSFAGSYYCVCPLRVFIAKTAKK
jgi:hypothetical protein